MRVVGKVAAIVALAGVPTLALGQSNLSPTTTACEGLRKFALASATITSASLIAAGPYAAPGAAAPTATPLVAPAHCRISAVLRPSADSEIEVALWLPTESWNGKFQAIGNGAWGGVINYQAMLSALQTGYAVAGTDTGHKVPPQGPEWAIGHREKLVDFGSRAVHEMVIASKALIQTFYSRPARYSYFDGCSTGGRQGLVAAQRYPADFDGIVAGAPVTSQPRLRAGDLALMIPTLLDPSKAVSTPKLLSLQRAVVNSCDPTDGVRDGIISEPLACKFDPAQIACNGEETNSCLTPAQLDTVRRGYKAITTPSGQFVAPAKWPGSEDGWAIPSDLKTPPIPWIATFQIAHNDAAWEWRGFDLEREVRVADDQVGRVMNAVDPDLSAFKARGGKLLLYHGMADGSVSPANTVSYYESVLAKMGSRQQDWLRMFLIPGMQHCGGGPGPTQINYIGAIERWRESGEAPDALLGAHVTGGRVDLTRAVCRYPQVARYRGTGTPTDAQNFVCKQP